TPVTASAGIGTGAGWLLPTSLSGRCPSMRAKASPSPCADGVVGVALSRKAVKLASMLLPVMSIGVLYQAAAANAGVAAVVSSSVFPLPVGNGPGTPPLSFRLV